METKAYEDAREREEKYLKTHFAEIKKTNTWNTVIKVVAFVLFYILVKYVVAMLTK